MAGIEDQAQHIVATAAEVARLKGENLEATILGQASAKLLMTGSSESFNESVDFFTLTLEIPVQIYAEIGSTEDVERRICGLVGQIARIYPLNRITQVVIAPSLAERSLTTKGSTDGQLPEDVPAFWTPGCFRLFISHISAMKSHAHQLKESLAKYHIAAFVAHDDIQVTKQWQDEIELALRTMDALAAIIAPGFVESSWCDQEVGFAMGRGKLIVSLASDVIPHGFLGKYQARKIKGMYPPAVADELFGILIRNPVTSERMTDALVDRIATSPNFETSHKRCRSLRKSRISTTPRSQS